MGAHPARHRRPKGPLRRRSGEGCDMADRQELIDAEVRLAEALRAGEPLEVIRAGIRAALPPESPSRALEARVLASANQIFSEAPRRRPLAWLWESFECRGALGVALRPPAIAFGAIMAVAGFFVAELVDSSAGAARHYGYGVPIPVSNASELYRGASGEVTELLARGDLEAARRVIVGVRPKLDDGLLQARLTLRLVEVELAAERYAKARLILEEDDLARRVLELEARLDALSKASPEPEPQPER